MKTIIKEPIVLTDSQEAAIFESRTLTGWWSRTGQFLGASQGSEEQARYNGATHRNCECGEITEKYKSYCYACGKKKRVEKVMSMPVVEWDMKTPLYWDERDEYIFDIDDIYRIADDEELDDEVFHLIVCVPNYYHEIDTDIWSDVFPEDSDGEVPAAMDQKIKELNEIISKMPPASWSPGGTRVEFPNPVLSK